MKVVWRILGGCAALASLTLVAVVQLIWAGSETSYYAQLSLMVLLMGGVLITARRSTKRIAMGAVFAAAAAAALMPLELTYFIFQNGPMNLAALASMWLIHLFLLGVFAISARQLRRRTPG